MPEFDVEKLLAEISPDEPCGPDLEYDDAFSEMERASQGKPEQQYGDTVVDAEEPDWKEVKSQSLDVLGRSKDLRAAVLLAKATLIEDGVSSFRDALAVVHGYVERYWAPVHPRLDPDDDDDATIRANTLNSLCHITVLDALREAPLATSRGLRVGYRDIALAKGKMTLPEGSEEEILGMTAINSVFAEVDRDELTHVAEAVFESLEHARATEAAMTEQVGAFDTCNLDDLTKELAFIDTFLKEKVAGRQATEASAEPSDSQPSNDSPSAASAPAAPSFSGEINSREDAIRAIDRVCQYFERHEPSSPLPLLLRRAKRLSTKSFLEIMKDISPEGVSQVEQLGGVDADDVVDSFVDPTPNPPPPPSNDDY